MLIQRIQNNQKKFDKAGKLILSDFKTYYKAVVIQILRVKIDKSIKGADKIVQN